MSQQHFTSYDQVIDFLYKQLPMFQKIGGRAFKKDLTNTIRLCEFLGHPEHQFKSIHVAGTNGKGSSSHFLAAILQQAGYRTGLYTSPHLKSFTERIKIDGKEIEDDSVVQFVNKAHPVIDEIKPSFFELTVGMAFDYFASQKVDIAIIEVGLGGRLDSTNVVIPEVSLITNISLDHQQWLGDTLYEIAGEKAGIIKDHIPVVISQRQDDIDQIFINKAKETSSEITFASDHYNGIYTKDQLTIKSDEGEYLLNPQLAGTYQKDNLIGVLQAIEIMNQRGFTVSKTDIINGVEHVMDLTGLKGRWQVLQDAPKVICDVGHNDAGVRLIVDQLAKQQHNHLHIIWGMVSDKDVAAVLALLPDDASYYFCQADIPRALSAQDLQFEASKLGKNGVVVEDVNDALNQALQCADEQDLIFVGGSTFVVAEIDGL